MGTNKQKKLRGFNRGVTLNRAVRMVTMAAPICPNSQVKVEIRDGRVQPAPLDPTKPNCQLQGGRWWEECEAKGHDPYYTTKHYTIDEPVYEDQNGERVMVDMKRVWKEDKYLNAVQVAQGTRHNSGQGVRRAVNLKGRKFLPAMGHEEVCQYRNCQNPVDFHYRSKIFGDYCGEDHYKHVAAAEQGEFLHLMNTGLAPEAEQRIRRARAEQLQRASAFGLTG
jgi:hypothetical protein